MLTFWHLGSARHKSFIYRATLRRYLLDGPLHEPTARRSNNLSMMSVPFHELYKYKCGHEIGFMKQVSIHCVRRVVVARVFSWRRVQEEQVLRTLNLQRTQAVRH